MSVAYNTYPFKKVVKDQVLANICVEHLQYVDELAIKQDEEIYVVSIEGSLPFLNKEISKIHLNNHISTYAFP